MLHSKLIKREEIAVIFTTLSEEYEMLGGNKQIDIYIVGGAAILLDFDYRMSTIDIDAYYKDDSILQKSINAVAKKLNLPSDWLNHDFVSTPSFSSNITKLSPNYQPKQKCMANILKSIQWHLNISLQ